MKPILFAFFALVACLAYADLLLPYNPSLHRIGYEVFVYVAGVVMGGALVRYLAKKNWRMSKEWKRYSEIEDIEAVEIEKMVLAIRPAFRSAVRMAYDKVDGLLKAGWKYDLVLAALETDEELMSCCKGIPIECLMSEAAEEVKSECETRLASVLPDFKTAFDAVYDDTAAEWLQKDAVEKKKANAEQLRRMHFYNSFWGKVRQLVSPEYRCRVATERILKSMPPNAGMTRYRAECWKDLCGSLVELILKRDEDLRNRCQGVKKKALVESVVKGIPGCYTGAYKSENMITPYGKTVYIDDGEEVDIEEEVRNIYKIEAQLVAREAERIVRVAQDAHKQKRIATASDVARKLDEVRPQLRSIFRKAYESEQEYLRADWKQKLILAVLGFVKKECLDVPIENLLTELMLEMRDNLKSRLAAVLPEARRAFDERYDTMAAEWLKKDEEAYKRTECYRKKCELSSLSGIIKGIFIPGYRRKSKRVISEYEKQVEFLPSRWKLGAPDPWLSLCESLADDILAEDKALKMKCRGVEYDALVSAVTRPHQPDGYKKGYKGEYAIQRQSTKEYENRTWERDIAWN